jgi:2-polyprenyl-6-methoxyphenol hydroxylase-like FAD-dependent oxidoreductase
MRDHYDVAIVGYGPGRSDARHSSRQRGWHVGVFEKQPYAYPLPRAVHFDHEIARILQSAGVAQGFAGLTETTDLYEWRNAAGQTLLRFASKPMGASGWPEGNMFAQPHLERVLDRRAGRFPRSRCIAATRPSVSSRAPRV